MQNVHDFVSRNITSHTNSLFHAFNVKHVVTTKVTITFSVSVYLELGGESGNRGTEESGLESVEIHIPYMTPLTQYITNEVALSS